MSGPDKSNRLIIIINSDLNMPPGLMAAQVSHVSELVGYNAARAMSDLSIGLEDTGLDILEYEYWRLNPITIIKRAPHFMMVQFIQEFGEKNIKFELFMDTVPGLIPDNSITCLAIYPGQSIPKEIDELGVA